MNVLEKIKKDEFDKFKKNKDLNLIPLKSEVSIKYLTQNKDLRIFRGVVIAKKNNGVNSFLTVCKTSVDKGDRLIYKFLYYSPNLIDVTVQKKCKKKPRRAKLNYFAKLCGKKAKI